MNHLRIHWTFLYFANLFYSVIKTYYILFSKPCAASSTIYPGWPEREIGSGVGIGAGSGVGWFSSELEGPQSMV